MTDERLPSMASKSVAVIGGGLAGCAAALSLARIGVKVTVLEARRRLGGRTGSFPTSTMNEPASSIDYCQHVGMGCCTNLRQLIRWLDQQAEWDLQRELHFYGPTGNYQRLRALPFAPAPFHLTGWLLKWPGLSWSDRASIARGMMTIGKQRAIQDLDDLSAVDWLQSIVQPARAIERFWRTIIVSALGEELDRVSLAAVCKVIQDGFLNHREAFQLLVPKLSLDELFNRRMERALRHCGVDVRLSQAVSELDMSDSGTTWVRHGEDRTRADAVIIAVPWHQLSKVKCKPALPELAHVNQLASRLESSPITGIHTWWDRDWLDTPHAVIVGRLSQWVFPQFVSESKAPKTGEHYYQIVISAARMLRKGNPSEINQLLSEDLRSVFPKVMGSKLLRTKVVTDPNAVFSVTPGSLQLRPHSKLNGRVFLAGDWTRSGWPATMEGAIISGFQASQGLLREWGQAVRFVCPPLSHHRKGKTEIP